MNTNELKKETVELSKKLGKTVTRLETVYYSISNEDMDADTKRTVLNHLLDVINEQLTEYEECLSIKDE